ncbi:MAG: hypothetical protein AAGH92_03820, partial [Planctomycetota bacterium]
MIALGPTEVQALELFRDAMETGAAWQNSADASDSRVTFGYDYVADGVPEAPNTRSNDLPRTGFKLESNLSTDDFRQNLFFADPILLSPVNENFSGNYRLRFDAWSNLDTNAYYNQNRFATSEWIGGGVRYEPSDSIFDDRGVRIQGKSDGDFDIAWNLYNNGSRVDDADTFIGDAESQIPYFADFLPSTFAPSSQLGNNVGPSPVGTPAFRWLTYELAITGDTVEITLEREDGERLPIAELTLAEEALDDPRTILLLYYDGYGPSFPPNPNLQFGLIDNVVVDRLIVRGDFN